MANNYRKILIANIKKRMEGRYTSAEALAKDCYWQSGSRKGTRISARHIRYAISYKDDNAPVPSADVIAAIAVALHCDVWELYFDEQTMRENLFRRMFDGGGPNATKIRQRMSVS